METMVRGQNFEPGSEQTLSEALVDKRHTKARDSKARRGFSSLTVGKGTSRKPTNPDSL